MWNHLPFDILSKVFSFLSPDSSACAASTCKQWHLCSNTCIGSAGTESQQPPWFLAMNIRNRGHACYAYNPLLSRWYSIPLDFVPVPIRPISSIGSIILFRSSSPSPIQFSLCNPFTKQHRFLSPLITPRTNPAVGLVEMDREVDQCQRPTRGSAFRIYVIGGMLENGSYERTLEMYDSQVGEWKILGLMPVEFAVRITVWTSNESVYSNGILYWITSARAYSIMAYNLSSGTWKELNVPIANHLEFAALTQRKGTLSLVGATCIGEACIWELCLGDKWVLVERVPTELVKSFLGCKGSWCSAKCVGSDECVYLYRDLGSEMLVWKEGPNKGKWEWVRIERCSSSFIKGEEVPNKFPIKGVLFHPSLDPSNVQIGAWQSENCENV